MTTTEKRIASITKRFAWAVTKGALEFMSEHPNGITSDRDALEFGRIVRDRLGEAKLVVAEVDEVAVSMAIAETVAKNLVPQDDAGRELVDKAKLLVRGEFAVPLPEDDDEETEGKRVIN